MKRRSGQEVGVYCDISYIGTLSHRSVYSDVLAIYVGVRILYTCVLTKHRYNYIVYYNRNRVFYD